MDVAVLSGSASTVVFVGSSLPMLGKAWRTRDVSSYSRGNLVLATLGNGFYSVYVVSLPVGPLWFLHLFNVLTTGFMLVWHLRYAGRPGEAKNRWEAGAKSSPRTPSTRSVPTDEIHTRMQAVITCHGRFTAATTAGTPSVGGARRSRRRR